MSTSVSDVTITLPDGAIRNSTLNSNANIESSKMAQRSFALYGVPLSSLRVFDAMHTNLPGTASADDLALITGTVGTDAPTIETGDLKAAGATTRKAAFEFTLPPNYEDGESVQVRITAGMVTTVSDTTATVDLEVYEIDGTGSVGSDLCTTSATSINSLTFADVDFTVTESGLVAGDHLVAVVSVAVNDAATGTEVSGVISKIQMRVDTRG